MEGVYAANDADKVYGVENQSKYDVKSLEQDSFLEDSVFNYSNNSNLFTNNISNVSNSIFDALKTVSKTNMPVEAADNNVGVGKTANILGGLFDWLIPDSVKKDGEIGSSSQHGTGDCDVLSAINSLSYTKRGKEIIKNALEYKDNGDIVVHFKGGYGDYTVTKEEYNKVRDEQVNGSMAYTTGDGDMLVMELAIEKALDDVGAGKTCIDYDNIRDGAYATPYGIRDYGQPSGSSLIGVYGTHVMNMLTGKETEIVQDSEKIKSEIDDYNGSDVALGCSWKFTETDENGVKHELPTKVKDAYGNDIELVGGHAYAIKDTSADTVTVTNPWNSGEDIVLSRDTFSKYVNCLKKCDMSDVNSDATYAKRSDYQIGNNKYGYISDDEDHSDDIDFFGEAYESYTKTEVRDNDGNLETTVYKDHQGNRKAFKDWGKKADGTEYVSAEGIYGDGGTRALTASYDENGKVTDHLLLQLDSNGNFKSSIGADSLSDRELHNIKDRDLLSYHKFELYEIKELAKLNDDDWKKVRKYVGKNPNASYDEVIKNAGVNL